jgi:hypothetical protein
LRCHRRTAQQEVHELGPGKTKRGIKIRAPTFPAVSVFRRYKCN